MERVEVEIHPDSLKELVADGKTFRSAFDFRLTEADLEIARKELLETEECRKSSLRGLKEILQGDTDFRYRPDDAYLLRYLRHKKFKVKDTYKFLRNFYKMRKDYPEIFLIPAHFETILESQLVTLLPYTDESGHMIFIFKFGKWNTNEMNMRELLKVVTCISDIISLNPHCQINGMKLIFDFEGTNMRHYAQILQPSNLRLWTKTLQEFYPWRINRILCLNYSAFLYAAFSTICLFLKKKIVERFTFLHSEVSLLPEYINPAILPEEYCGRLQDDECYSYLKHPIYSNVRYLDYEHSFSLVSK